MSKKQYYNILSNQVERFISTWFDDKKRKAMKIAKELKEISNIRKKRYFREKMNKNKNKNKKTKQLSCLIFYWKKYESFEKELEYFELFRN